jgi:hypothetical protein
MSAESSLPLIGSTPFSTKYFSIRRLSNMAPDTGDMTGCSGTSLETVIRKYQASNLWSTYSHFSSSSSDGSSSNNRR